MIADSNVVYNQRDQTMDCIGCLASIPVRLEVLRRPDHFVEMLELAQLDHQDCHKYDSVQAARNARIFRARMKRIQREERRRRLPVKAQAGKA